MDIPIIIKSEKKNKSSVVENKKPNVFNVIQCKSKRNTEDGGGYGTGKRKNSIARVWLKPGNGKILVNNRDLSDYFPRQSYVIAIHQVFSVINSANQYDVISTVKGGGVTGQSGAIIHGIARALDCISNDFHVVLRKYGFLTRDSRVVERKKYGKRKARKSTQFSKR